MGTYEDLLPAYYFREGGYSPSESSTTCSGMLLTRVRQNSFSSTQSDHRPTAISHDARREHSHPYDTYCGSTAIIENIGKVKCTLCQQLIDRFQIRRHKEEECPERLETCCYCQVKLPHALLAQHLTSCSPRRREESLNKPRVSGNRELSFKGTVFESHARIATSFLNMARGYTVDSKSLTDCVVKAEAQNQFRTLPSAKDVLSSVCPSTPYLARDKKSLLRHCESRKKDVTFRQVATLLSDAITHKEEQKRLRNEEMNSREIHQPRATATPPSFKAPKNARKLRRVHEKLASASRDHCSHKKFIKSWLRSFYVSREQWQEAEIKAEEALEDELIDEAIELEMKRELVSKISEDKWPHFVHDIKERRRKWKDFGFDMEEEEAAATATLSSGILRNKLNPKTGGLKDRSSPGANTKRDLNLYEIHEKRASSSSRFPRRGGGGGGEEAASGGLYKFCDHCHELFHEDELKIHMTSCKAVIGKRNKVGPTISQRNKGFTATLTRARINNKTGTSSQQRLGRGSELKIPRPLGGDSSCPSLALRVAPHLRHHGISNRNDIAPLLASL